MKKLGNLIIIVGILLGCLFGAMIFVNGVNQIQSNINSFKLAFGIIKIIIASPTGFLTMLIFYIMGQIIKYSGGSKNEK